MSTACTLTVQRTSVVTPGAYVSGHHWIFFSQLIQRMQHTIAYKTIPPHPTWYFVLGFFLVCIKGNIWKTTKIKWQYLQYLFPWCILFFMQLLPKKSEMSFKKTVINPLKEEERKWEKVQTEIGREGKRGWWRHSFLSLPILCVIHGNISMNSKASVVTFVDFHFGSDWLRPLTWALLCLYS